MEDRGQSEFRLTGLTPDALIKSSSEASSLLPPTHHLVPPILPSLDAYLDAYRSLMSHDMSALGSCGIGIRPPGLTMPVLPTAAAAAAAAASLVSSPYYGLSPYSVDLARYGLLSPVFVPPFIGPLLCGGGAGPPVSGGLLPVAEPPQSSPAAPRSSSDREGPVCPPQSYAKPLLEPRKNDSAVTATVRAKQPDSVPKPAHRDKPSIAPLASPRPTDLLTDRKWNSSSGKVDWADVLPQSSAAAVDFSARRTSDVSLKSSVTGSALSPDSWKFASTSASSLVAGKNTLSNSTQSYGSLSSAIPLQKKFDKVDTGPVKPVRNGELQRDVGVKTGVDSNRASSLTSADQLPKHKVPVVAVSQNDEARIVQQPDASSVCRVTSSGLSESDGLKSSTDVSGVGARRPARPSAKKRPAEPLPGGSGQSSPVDSDGKSRGGIGNGSVEEFRCRLCNYSGRSQHCLSKHYRAHDLAYKICRYCRRAFERPSDLLRHEERHRRRDVMGSGGSGGVDAAGEAAGGCSEPDGVRQPGVGRIDTYSDGVVASSALMSARLGPGDNEVILCFDEPAADALAEQPTAPPPSKLRDVYSIMAGIFVNQHLLSLGQSAPVVEQASPRSGVDDRGPALVPDFGQQAFLQMLDLKVVSESDGSHVSGPGSAAVASGGSRDRRRKGLPNRAVSHQTAETTNVSLMNFSSVGDSASDVLSIETAKLRCGGTVDDVSPSNGAVTGKTMKLGPESDNAMLANGLGLSTQDRLMYRRRSRKFFSISCKVCGKRPLQGFELGRHWLRHSVQDADGCYSCAACSFTSNVRLIMHSHAHVHLIRHRSTTSQTRRRCRLCSKPRRSVNPVSVQTEEDGRRVRSLWCADCSLRTATSRLLKLSSWRRRGRCSPKGFRRRSVRIGAQRIVCREGRRGAVDSEGGEGVSLSPVEETVPSPKNV